MARGFQGHGQSRVSSIAFAHCACLTQGLNGLEGLPQAGNGNASQSLYSVPPFASTSLVRVLTGQLWPLDGTRTANFLEVL